MDVNPDYSAAEVTCLESSHQNYMGSNICVLYTYALFIDLYILVSVLFVYNIFMEYKVYYKQCSVPSDPLEIARLME